eukprot:g2064.t1
MSDFIGFIVFVGEVFRELVRASFDVLCSALLLCALCVPWRVCAVLKALSKADSRADWEGACWIEFGLSLLDVLILPFALLGLCVPWRVLPLCCTVAESRERDFYWTLRGYAFLNFWAGLLDILLLPSFLLSVLTLYRAADVCRQLGSGPDSFWNPQPRAVVWRTSLVILLDCLLLPIFLLIGLTVYRWRPMRYDMSARDGDNELLVRWVCLQHVAGLLLDLPVFLLAGLVCLFGYRTKTITAIFSRRDPRWLADASLQSLECFESERRADLLLQASIPPRRQSATG